MKRCIVIDREYGSGGREIAKILSEKTGMPYYDGQRLLAAARRYGMDTAPLAEHDEKGVGSLLFDMTRYMSRYNHTDAADNPYKVYQARGKLIRQLAGEQSCIFLGRCADEVLSGETEILSVFVYSTDPDEKTARAMKVDGIPAERVASHIVKMDDRRRRYYKVFAGKEWGGKENYDLCLNTSKLGYEKAAEAILSVWNT